jgi:hypothetical protein
MRIRLIRKSNFLVSTLNPIFIPPSSYRESPPPGGIFLRNYHESQTDRAKELKTLQEKCRSTTTQKFTSPSNTAIPVES